MSLRAWTFLVVGLTFAVYIVIAIRSRVSSTSTGPSHAIRGFSLISALVIDIVCGTVWLCFSFSVIEGEGHSCLSGETIIGETDLFREVLLRHAPSKILVVGFAESVGFLMERLDVQVGVGGFVMKNNQVFGLRPGGDFHGRDVV